MSNEEAEAPRRPLFILPLRPLRNPPGVKMSDAPFNFEAFLDRLTAWSTARFKYVPGQQAPYHILQSIHFEMQKLSQDGFELNHWIDIIMLALVGAHQSGQLPPDIIKGLKAELDRSIKNWPAPLPPPVRPDAASEAKEAP